MKKIINMLRGYAELEVAGDFPERLLNLCAQTRLIFWHLRWLDGGSFRFRVALTDVKRLEGLAERAMCSVTEVGRRGAAAQAQRLSRRWGFVAGLVLCLAAVFVMSQFLLVVEVEGNEQVPTAVILSELQRLGVRPGAYGPSIQTREVANEALISLPELSYMAINISGTRAVVQVREAEEKPELLDEETPADVVAAADGIIEDIQTTAGRSLFVDGDIVAEGEVLITGTMQLNEIGGDKADAGQLVVHAAGTVTARTWRTLEETIPLTVQTKVYTGEERTLRSLDLLWWRLDFFQNSSIFSSRYDKITQTGQITLFGLELPAWITTSTLREYTLEEVELDQDQAARQLQEVLESRLAQLLEPGEGQVLRQDFVTQVQGDLLTVTLVAECREQIGRTVEREGETGHFEPSTDNGEES